MNHPYLPNRVLALVKLMFNLAVEWEFLPADFPNPARISGVFREPMLPRAKLLGHTQCNH